MEKKNKLSEIILTVPSVVWLIIFFIIPTILVFTIAFKSADPLGDISDGWNLDAINSALSLDYLKVLLRTIWISLICTVICLILAVGVGYWIAQQPIKYKNLYLLLIIIPLWTNFLIRIFAWRMVLQPEGFIRTFLLKIGLIDPETYLLNNMTAVIIVTVYTCLPFAVLPIYAAAEKFDFSLMDAARDLGASNFTAFRKIFLKGIQRGILTAALLVLIPALGSYAIPDLVGGVDSSLFGNKIALKSISGRNLPEASALSGLLWMLIAAVILIILICQQYSSIQRYFIRIFNFIRRYFIKIFNSMPAFIKNFCINTLNFIKDYIINPILKATRVLFGYSKKLIALLFSLISTLIKKLLFNPVSFVFSCIIKIFTFGKVDLKRTTKSQSTSFAITILVMIFMYLPIAYLLIQSFNNSKYGGEWQGFTFKWYEKLFDNSDIIDATINTLIIALVATVISTLLGTIAAWVLNKYKTKTQKAHGGIMYAPLLVPDVLMGISFLLLFVNIGVELGLTTVILAHVTFCLSYVTFTVLARLQDFDFNIVQAAQDLGAGNIRIFFKIILPMLAPGIIAGALMAFTLSMDDFVVTVFVGGPGSTTLPVKVYSMMKHGEPAIINALSVLFMALTLTVAIIGQVMMKKKY